MYPTQNTNVGRRFQKNSHTGAFFRVLFPVISISTCFFLIFCSPFYDEWTAQMLRDWEISKHRFCIALNFFFQWRKSWRAFVGKTEMLYKRTNLNHSAFHCLGVNNIRLRHVATPPFPHPVRQRQGAKQTRLLLSTPTACLLTPPGQGCAILRSCQSNTSASVHRPKEWEKDRGEMPERKTGWERKGR